MATDLEIVRSLIADPFQYDSSRTQTDGIRRDYAVPNSPIRPATQTVYLAGATQVAGVDYTIDYGLGLITFTSLPAADQELVVTYQWSFLADTDLQIQLDLEGGIVKLGAAGSLDTIASSEALIQKVITLLDLKTDGAAVAKALREHASQLRDQVANPIGSETALDGLFATAEMIHNSFGYRERIWKDALRQQA